MTESVSIEQELREGRSVVIGTQGVSMRPLLWEGRTKAAIAPLERPLRVGDVPLVKLPDGRFRLHRLVKIAEDGYFTRGDNTVALEKIQLDDCIGRMTDVYKGKKVIVETGRGYRAYVRFWLWSAPVRVPIYRLKAICLCVLRRLTKRGRNSITKTK